MASENYLQVFASDQKKVINFIAERKSFEIVDIPRGEMAKIVKFTEKEIESQGLKVRVYTKGRIAGAAAGFLGGPLGAAVAAGIVAHNLATINPDYEIAKHLLANKLTVDYVADTTLGESVGKSIDDIKDSMGETFSKLKNVTSNVWGTVVQAGTDTVYWADDVRKELFSEKNIQKTREKINELANESWKLAKEQPQKAMEKYNNLDKGYKILVLTGIAGGTIIALPFAVAAASGCSIISALAILGGGAVTAGGWGVAGGIIVTAGGTALSASVAATLGHKFISDPELEAFLDVYEELEKKVQKNFTLMEKHQEKYKGLYRKYAEISKYMLEMQQQIENGEKYDIHKVREFEVKTKVLVEDMEKIFEHGAEEA